MSVIISKRRLWLARFFVMIFAPLLVLGVSELGLRLAGYGYDTSFFRRIRINGHDFFVPNEKFSYRFFPPALARTITPFRFDAEIATNSYRIFLFGESAAMGEPDSTYGVGRYLEVLLRERYPGIDFHVICLAVTAIDSNTILPIARESAWHRGDLWLIYMGNNEMVGPFGAETVYGPRAPNLEIIRALLAIRTMRIGQLVDEVGRWLRNNSSTPKEWGGMQMFMNARIGYEDPARLRAYSNFKGNLNDILEAAHRAKVPVILSTVAVNLKECAPFASVHKTNLNTNQLSTWNKIFNDGVGLQTDGSYPKARVLYQKAAAIDPQYAELQFRMGECDLALTNLTQARQDFEWARDYDALDFRADTRINSIIREAAAHHAKQNVYLLDAANALAQKSPDGIPGLNFFYEHVHLNFAGNYLLALNFAEQIKKLLPAAITQNDNGNWASSELCDRRLAVTVWDRQRIWQSILDRIISPPFTGQFNHTANLKTYEAKLNEVKSMMNTQTPGQARQIYEQALALTPDDYFLHANFERFLEAGGYLTQAIAEAKRCCELAPQLAGGYYYTGTLLVRAGKINEATNYFSRAIITQNDYAEAEDALGEVLANQKRIAGAMFWFQRAIRAKPNYVETYFDLGFLEQGQGNASEAMANYRKAANLEPEGPADYFYRANVAAASYDWNAVISCLQAVVNVKPAFWQAHYMLGIELMANGKIDEAQKQFVKAIQFRPDYVPAHLYLGTALVAKKNFDQALAEFRTVLQLDPANNSAQEEVKMIERKQQPNRS